jgi:hypothetical protein
MRTAARRHTISNTTQLADTAAIVLVVLEEDATAVAPRLVDSSVEVSPVSCVISGGEVMVVSLGGGVVASDGLGTVMMVSGRHMELLPMNITSARGIQLKPGRGKNCR